MIFKFSLVKYITSIKKKKNNPRIQIQINERKWNE